MTLKKAKSTLKILRLIIFAVMYISLISCAVQDAPIDNMPSQNTPNKADDTTEPAQNMGTDTPEPTQDPYDVLAKALLQDMSLEEKVYQLFIVTPEQLFDTKSSVTEADDAIHALLRYPVCGVVLFADNIKTPKQLSKMIDDLQAASDLGLFIATDEEGGSVARLGNNDAMGVTKFPSMSKIGASGDTEGARNVGKTIGSDMKKLGFNLNFAPIADVNSNPNNPVIGRRAFSSDPNTCAEMVAACVKGFHESGIMCTLKHFPGHGDTTSDSHFGAVSSEKTLDELMSCEFIPFKSGIDAGADMVMIGHIALPSVTGDNTPSTFSYEIITGILKDKLNFNGIIITDSMSMGAITDTASSGEAAVSAVQAGADIILMPKNLKDAANEIINALERGDITAERIDESVYRIIYAKLQHGIISTHGDM